jgi:5-methylcytosine-specific restriction endonuclease McrA
MRKICTRCKVNKSLKDYYEDNRTKDGKRPECKSCYKEYFKSEKGKLAIAKYNKSDKGKLTNAKAVAKYLKSDKGKLTQAKYNKTDKGKLNIARKNHNKRNWKSKTINNLTINEKNIILFLQNYRCIGDCGRYFDKMEPTIDHIVPLSKSGDLIKENVQYLCQSCNSKKGIKHIDYRSTIHKQYIKTMELICHNNHNNQYK